MKKTLLTILGLCGLFLSCHNDYTPKPQAYLRIDMPEHNYWLVDTLPHLSDTTIIAVDGSKVYFPPSTKSFLPPFLFEANECIELATKDSPREEVWIDLNYPQWNGVVFLTYKRIKGIDDLRAQIDTSSQFLEQHYQYTSGIEEQGFENPENNVYGTVYYLKGSKVASTCQFWMTDSTHNFLRGALYLNTTPNNDSLAPVIDYMQADIEHLVETLRWRY